MEGSLENTHTHTNYLLVTDLIRVKNKNNILKILLHDKRAKCNLPPIHILYETASKLQK
jgi:hypothetical protein